MDFSMFLGCFQKNLKSSPRWQYNDAKRSKENKTGSEVIEDERDPDVIPAQYGKLVYIFVNLKVGGGDQ